MLTLHSLHIMLTFYVPNRSTAAAQSEQIIHPSSATDPLVTGAAHNFQIIHPSSATDPVTAAAQK